jgi:antirestriction protein
MNEQHHAPSQPDAEQPAACEAIPRDGPEQSARPSPRIYVASLSDYNAGILHGQWIPADQEADEVWAGVNEMLAASPTTRRWGEPAEEWAIHDFEGFGPVRLGEYENLEHVAALARAMAEHGNAYAAFASLVGSIDPEQLSDFEDRYIGEHDSLEAYGDQLLEDMGIDLDRILADSGGMLGPIRGYIHVDVPGWVRDLELGGDISTEQSDRGVYVFRN